MKKIFKIIRNIILAILFILYAALIVTMSILVLNRNEFGYTRFGENDIIFIDKDNESVDYKAGSLVITQLKLIEELKAGDKVFVYQTNEEKQEVKVIYSEILEVVDNEASRYIKLKEDGSAWGMDYVAGQAIKCYQKIGAIVSALETKVLFFVVLILPVFFIFLVEIYQFIITLKYDEEDDETTDDTKQKTKPEKEIKEKKEEKVEVPKVTEVKEETPEEVL